MVRCGPAGWVRYGATRVTEDEVAFAAAHYRVAVLQPWEVDAAASLKAARPDMVVLAYKCLCSTRSYECGPVYSSGVCFAEAQESGEEWFAHRCGEGARVEWASYPGHWQMAVWEPDYRERWCDNVADELDGSPFDGVMADNDVFDDYYGLRPPLDEGRGMAELRAGLLELVEAAGARLQGLDKLVVPNIAESRREAGRWQRHAAFGGGFEEVWLAYGPDDYLDPAAVEAQVHAMSGQGVVLLRTASDGDVGHRNHRYGLAAAWVYGFGETGAYTATASDAYDGTPYSVELGWDLGAPVGGIVERGNGRSRAFTGGWAAVNLNSAPRRRVTFSVPPSMVDAQGVPAPPRLTLHSHEGAVLRRAAPASGTHRGATRSDVPRRGAPARP